MSVARTPKSTQSLLLEAHPIARTAKLQSRGSSDSGLEDQSSTYSIDLGKFYEIAFSGFDGSSANVEEYNQGVFAKVFRVLDDMKDAEISFVEPIDDETSLDAGRVLAYIQASGIRPPSIFSHGGDSVVFKWDKGRRSHFLTVTDGQAAFLEVDKYTKFQCPHAPVPLDAPPLDEWLISVDVPIKQLTNDS